MTPKEKAKDLYYRFQVYEVNGLKRMKYGPEVKVFTLIAVNEILSNPLFFSDYGELHFWQSVKQEIEKL